MLSLKHMQLIGIFNNTDIFGDQILNHQPGKVQHQPMEC